MLIIVGVAASHVRPNDEWSLLKLSTSNPDPRSDIVFRTAVIGLEYSDDGSARQYVNTRQIITNIDDVHD